MNAMIVYGPQGCGKTHNAQVIAKCFGLTSILDGWHGKGELPPDTLVLTNVQGIEGAQDYYKVMYDIYANFSPARVLANETGWAMVEREDGNIKCIRFKDGAIDSVYPFAPKEHAAVYAVAIVSGYAPPRFLRNYDKQSGNECQCKHFQIVGAEGFTCESTGRISKARCQQSQAQFFEARQCCQ